jgi:hypothetical protein
MSKMWAGSGPRLNIHIGFGYQDWRRALWDWQESLLYG